MRWVRWIIGAAFLATLMWAAYWVVATYLLGRALSECSNEILSEAMSPNSRYVATAFERSCGATTPFVRIVNIRPSDKSFDGEDTDRYVFVIEGQSDIRLAWSGPEDLTVKYSGGFRVARQAVTSYGISVSYE